MIPIYGLEREAVPLRWLVGRSIIVPAINFRNRMWVDIALWVRGPRPVLFLFFSVIRKDTVMATNLSAF